MIALMRSTNATFAQNLASPTGVAAVTWSALQCLGARIFSQKIAGGVRTMLIVKLICLVLGTALAVLFIFQRPCGAEKRLVLKGRAAEGIQ